MIKAEYDELMANHLCDNLQKHIQNSEIFTVQSSHNNWMSSTVNQKIQSFIEN